MRILKKALLALGVPLARLMEGVLQPATRLVAAARFGGRLRFPIDPSVVVLSAPEVHGTGAVELGRDLYLYRDLYLETRETATIRIGDRVVISRGTHLVALTGIEIGDGTMIGEYTSIRDANHRVGEATDIRDSGHDAKPISIGRNVWIGRGVTILPGVRIGDGAVIGANAVVVRDIPEGAIAVGVPARPLESKRRAA
jgi:acetyltransferase-like isoleucine patch superfamily enzyme